ncbi:MAG: hypothetical protein QXZ24_04500 [Candidatus Jordarchaeales archaeon]
MEERCAVINCGQNLKENEGIELDGKKYCKKCATLIMKEVMTRLIERI